MDIYTLHKKFSEYGMNAKQWLRKCALLLPEIQRKEVWKHKGFSSIYEYAFKLTGMNKAQIDDALRIVKKIEDKPLLIKVVEEKGVNAVRPVAAIATKETEIFWAKKADTMTKNELEIFVKAIREESSSNLKSEASLLKTKIILELKAETAKKLKALNKNSDWESLVSKMIELYENHVAQEENKNLKEEISFMNVSKPKVVKTKSRHIPKKIEKFINIRSKGHCEFPNCKNKATVKHHTERFSTVWRHDTEKIINLCDAHHNLAHKGLISNENLEVSHWKIRKEADLTDLNTFIDEKVQFYRRV